MATIDTDNIISRLSDAKQALILARGGSGVGNPQRRYMWEISIPGKELNGSFLNAIRFYAKTAAIPQESIEQINIRYLGNPIAYVGMENNAHIMNMTFWDDEHLTVYSYMKQWKDLTREPGRGRAASKKSIVSDIVISLKDTTDVAITGKFVFHNCFPTEIGEIPLDYETSDAIEIPMSFSFDEMEVIT